ncbi:hypothetical protein ACFL1H_00410 [Nanoarchaeota archaeon]
MIEKLLKLNLLPEPILKPTLPSEGDNIYAPFILKHNNIYKMWYGGQGPDGKDRIHYATSNNKQEWQKHGPILEGKNHVNDPSVIIKDNKFYMYYTDCYKKDEIHLAISDNGINWTKIQQVLEPTENSWDSNEVARPSLIYEDNLFKMWYDGNQDRNTGRNVGYATSTDGIEFIKHNIVYKNEGAINVTKINNQYLMLMESRQGTYAAIGNNETEFQNKHLVLPKQDKYDKHGHVTPFYFENEIYMGLATSQHWNRNRIGKAQLP